MIFAIGLFFMEGLNEQGGVERRGRKRGIAAQCIENLAYLMERAGVDAAHLSEAIGLGVATINNIKRGVGNPTLLTLMELARFLTSSSVISSKASWGGRSRKPCRTGGASGQVH